MDHKVVYCDWIFKILLLNNKMDSFDFNGTRMTNLEMETSAIYGQNF